MVKLGNDRPFGVSLKVLSYAYIYRDEDSREPMFLFIFKCFLSKLLITMFTFIGAIAHVVKVRRGTRICIYLLLHHLGLQRCVDLLCLYEFYPLSKIHIHMLILT